MFTRFILMITKPKISHFGKRNTLALVENVPFSPLWWFWRLNYQPASDSILSAVLLCSAWIWENLRKQCKTAAKLCSRFFQMSNWLETCILVLFQCKHLADGKYQSKVLGEGSSKDFGSQDKSFPEGTFWINLVRSSQQSFSLRIFTKRKSAKSIVNILQMRLLKDVKMKVFPCLVWKVLRCIPLLPTEIVGRWLAPFPPTLSEHLDRQICQEGGREFVL